MAASKITRSVESFGFVHVAEAQDRVGLGTYVAKYVVKRWEAVPAWMGESRRRWRKFRASPGFYDVLERLYRHDRHRGSRPEPSGRRLRTRTLYQRMAASGTRIAAAMTATLAAMGTSLTPKKVQR